MICFCLIIAYTFLKYRLIRMSLTLKELNQRFKYEIAIILIIKVVVLLAIKNIWFNAPTIPKDFDNQVAERIAGSPSDIKETR